MNEIYVIIFKNVHNGIGNHGHFLRAFAKAVVYADNENRVLLEKAAIAIVLKYDLYNKPYIEEN